jgi:ACS family allantoate permease-like MFS transporter
MDEEKAPRPTMDPKLDPKLEKHSHDADEAMKAFENIEGETITIDEETNKRLLKIIDWHMMPIMCFVYGMNYLDSIGPRFILDSIARTDGC